MDKQTKVNWTEIELMSVYMSAATWWADLQEREGASKQCEKWKKKKNQNKQNPKVSLGDDLKYKVNQRTEGYTRTSEKWNGTLWHSTN